MLPKTNFFMYSVATFYNYWFNYHPMYVRKTCKSVSQSSVWDCAEKEIRWPCKIEACRLTRTRQTALAYIPKPCEQKMSQSETEIKLKMMLTEQLSPKPDLCVQQRNIT